MGVKGARTVPRGWGLHPDGEAQEEETWGQC